MFNIIIMKKIFFSLLILLFAVGYINAQSFSLEWDGEVLGDTITILSDSATASEIIFEAMVYNNTLSGVNLKVVKNEMIMMEGSGSYFCVDTCFPNSVDTSTTFMFIPAGGSSAPGYFSGHYEINDAVGISIVEYTYYNIDNPEENVKIVVKFDNSPAGVNENMFNNILISEIYPNPATNFVNINYELPTEVKMASVKIINLLGSVVMEQYVDTRNNNIRMNISNLNEGIYFYSFLVNGKVLSTKKLIIR